MGWQYKWLGMQELQIAGDGAAVPAGAVHARVKGHHTAAECVLPTNQTATLVEVEGTRGTHSFSSGTWRQASPTIHRALGPFRMPPG